MKIPERCSQHFGNSSTPSCVHGNRKDSIGRFSSRTDRDAGRNTFAPSTKPKFMREMIAKEPLPSPVKKTRVEAYKEAKRLVQKVTESKPATPVIAKKAELYAAAVEKPSPQRKAVPKRIPVPQQKTKTSVDTATKPVENSEKNQEAKESVIDPKDTKASAKPNEHGQYELSPVMSSTLHDELQQVMDKVREELPDAPQTEAERLVVDKFRREAGDDLHNAMGLSVTSRLLNVHNPLYVKLHFSGKPEAGRLQAFIREYKITAFKRIGDSLRDTFAARFDQIADFDRFCVHDQVKCGTATVTITPCYKYLSCPRSLKAIYFTNIAKTKTRPTTNSSPQKQADIVKKEKIAESAEVKPVTKDVVKKVNAETDKSDIPQANATNKTVKTGPNPKMEAQKTVAAKVVLEKPKPEIKAAKEVPEVKKVTPKKENKNEAVKNDAVDKIKNGKELEGVIDEMMVVDEMGEVDDDEEMTDQDILALMSGGIVLDECSGSEDEK